MVNDHPQLVSAGIEERCAPNRTAVRSLLHIATDWPGHFPNVAQTIVVLVAAGADVNARFVGKHTETPLHWAASSDDLAAVDALLDAGAEIEATGSVIGGGTPLADAVAFGQWHAARRLIERGAKVTLWQAAGLGLIDEVREQAASATADEITSAFWSACHGGQRAAAEMLLERGADLNWIGYGGLTPLDVARQTKNTAIVEWLRERGAVSTQETRRSDSSSRSLQDPGFECLQDGSRPIAHPHLRENA